MLQILRRSLDSSADQNDGAASEDADPSAVIVVEGSANRECSDLCYVVNDEDESGRCADTGQPEAFVVRCHGVDSTHQRAI